MSVKSELIKLSAQMTLANNMPSKYYDDWDWPKGMQITSWVKVEDAAEKAEKQCREWALKLIDLAREIDEESCQCPKDLFVNFSIKKTRPACMVRFNQITPN